MIEILRAAIEELDYVDSENASEDASRKVRSAMNMLYVLIAAMEKQEPVAVVDADDERMWADILPDVSVKVRQVLYEHAQPVEQPSAVTSPWQDIATAPTETEVLIGAFIDGEFEWGRSEMFYEQANDMEGETFSGWVWSVDEVSESVAECPTHWMPLPTAPGEQAIRSKQA